MTRVTYGLQVTYLRGFLRPLSFAALPAVIAAALVLPRGRDLRQHDERRGREVRRSEEGMKST